MKNIYTLTIALFLSISLCAQDDGESSRKGKILLETGSSFITGFSSSTGGSVIFDDGNSLTQLGLDIGKFISEDLAIKAKVGVLGGTGSTLTNFQVGAKYYIAGVAPLEVNAGILSGFGDTNMIADVHIGYAIVLADNIYLEPKGGLLISDGETLGSLKFSFAMLF